MRFFCGVANQQISSFYKKGRSTNAAVTTSDARSSNPSASGATPTDPPTSSSISRAASTTMNAAHSGVTSCNSQQTTRSKVLLAIAVVIIVGDAGMDYFARVLLDFGSECCFATSHLSQIMNVKRTRVDVPVAGIGKSALKVQHQFRAVIKSRNSDYTTIASNCSSCPKSPWAFHRRTST